MVETFTGPRQQDVVTRLLTSLSKLPDSPRALPVLVGFSALLMGTLFFVRINSDLNYDGEIYIAAAMKFAGGMYREGLAIYNMPAYPLLIALVQNVIPDWVSAGRTISLFAMVLTAIPLYRLANDLFDSRAAFWTCLVFILLPETLIHSNTVLRNPPFFLFFTWAAYFAQRTLRTKRTSHLLYAAVFAWISTLFRIEGLVLFPICFAVFFGLTAFSANERGSRLRLTTVWGCLLCLMIACVFVITYTPAVTWLNRYSDWIFYFNGYTGLSLLENHHRILDHLRYAQETSTLYGVGLHVAETVRIFLPLFYPLGVILTLSATILPINWIPLLWGIVRTDFAARHILLLSLTAGFLMLAIGFFIRTEVTMERYLIMPAILLSPWIGCGIESILKSVQRFSRYRLAAGLIVAAVFVVPGAQYGSIFKTTDDLSSEAADWLAARSNSRNFKVVFNDQIVKFHTDMNAPDSGKLQTVLLLDLTDKSFSKLAAFASEHRADLIVVLIRPERHNDFEGFSGYREIKEFSRKRKNIKIFIREELRLGNLFEPYLPVL
jgi:4-amino-4-deoxy-L-arabinose transferase-like glycosyltransferase